MYAIQYDPRDAEDARAWYTAFADMIPCETCRTKYRKILESQYALTPHALASARKLFEWTVTVHNAVNMFLRKRLVSLPEARQIYGL